MIIGITGACCSGKNSVADFLSENGFHITDLDKLGHRALASRKKEAAEIFGKSILADDGEINRKVLGGIVFSDPSALEQLERLLHPVMVEWAKMEIQQNKAGQTESDVAINGALLFKMGLHIYCDVILIVKAPLPVRIYRAVKRDGPNFRQIFKRFRSQRKLFVNLPSESVDIYSIWNFGTRRKLKKKVTVYACRANEAKHMKREK